MSVFTDEGWKVADRDEFLRPDTTLEALATLRTPFRAGGRVTAGNSAGLTDGATAALIASEEAAAELGLDAEDAPRRLRVRRSRARAHGPRARPGDAHGRSSAPGSTIDDVDLFELNEPFAVQVLSWCDGMGVAPDDPRLNPYGGAIACGHPLAATGVRLMAQLARGFRDRPGSRYGLTALCIGLGMGAALLWENLQPMASPATEFKLQRVETRVGPIALVTMDNGEDWQKPNTFGEAALRSLEGVLDRLRTRDWRGLLLTGKPFVFAAGADIDEFGGHHTGARARWAVRPGTSSSAASRRSRSSRSPQSTGRRSAAASRSPCTATTGRFRRRFGTSPAPRCSSDSSPAGAERSSSRSSWARRRRCVSSSRIRSARTG